jgi:hypothetical protein
MRRRKLKSGSTWGLKKQNPRSKEIKAITRLIKELHDAQSKQWNEKTQLLGRLLDKVFGLKVKVTPTNSRTYATLSDPSRLKLSANPFNYVGSNRAKIAKAYNFKVKMKGMKFLGLDAKKDGSTLYMHMESLQKGTAKAAVKTVMRCIGDIWVANFTTYKIALGLKAIKSLSTKKPPSFKAVAKNMVREHILLKGEAKGFVTDCTSSIPKGQTNLGRAIKRNVIDRQMTGLQFVTLYTKNGISLEASKFKRVVFTVLYVYAVAAAIFLLIGVIASVATGHIIIAFIQWLLYIMHHAIAKWSFKKLKKNDPNDKTVTFVEGLGRMFKRLMRKDKSEESYAEVVNAHNYDRMRPVLIRRCDIAMEGY